MYTGGSVPSVGTTVLTRDGDELGHVKEIIGECFKIDAPMAPDYWLGTDCVSDSTGGIVHLSFTKDELGEMKQDSPEHQGYHRHMN
jgi:hypothetical protein